jgi:ubiquinone/menaquinone biosynthesis C-methylase UbiE
MSTRAHLSVLGRVPGLIVGQQFRRQQLKRIPEPREEMTHPEQVAQFDRAVTTNLVIPYACALELIHRFRENRPAGGGAALDLACGPGNFSLSLLQHLGYHSVTGVDLSPEMVAAARRNAVAAGLAHGNQFLIGNATETSSFGSATMDLTCFTYAAHHLPNRRCVKRVVREMDRITRSDGVVLVLDLVRLRTRELTERFVKFVAQDYERQGLSQFLTDFRASMYAAWTVSELRRVIPRYSARPWLHIVPRGLPALQVILGLPVGRTRRGARPGLPWHHKDRPVPDAMVPEWNILRLAMRLGSWRFFPHCAQASRVSDSRDAAESVASLTRVA